MRCSSCATEFLVTIPEQVFRRDHNLPMPRLCPDCRSVQRSVRHGELLASREREEPVSSRRRDVRAAMRRRRGGADTGFTARTYHAVCAACGAETRVPFAPRGDRPVYCRDCFNARQGR